MQGDVDVLNQISEKVIGAAFTVANTLGTGFLEKVYENALAHELRKFRLSVEQQKFVEVYYDGVVVGSYAADLLVESVVLIELKATKSVDSAHLAQCLNYLKATGLRLGLVLNFGTARIGVHRVVNNL